MRFQALILCGLWGLFAIGDLSAQTNQCPLTPLPAPLQTTNVVPLSPGEQLGKDIFFDPTLSNPEGYSCATCHIPQSGFTGPSSCINTVAGPVPGVIPGRFGRRKPQAIPYATYSPIGPFFIAASEGGTYFGGDFWDGRATDTATQARMPFLDQNEMANQATGAYPPHAGGYSSLVTSKLTNAPYTALFQQVFGSNVFNTYNDQQIYSLMTAAIGEYEASAEVNPFSSKWDASTNGTPAQELYQFNASEQNGEELFFGKAQCFQCHSAASFTPVSDATQGKEVFTMYCYANIGVPANPGNPFYMNTNCASNPIGCNALGPDFIDFGMGANPNPAPDGTVFFDSVPGDLPQYRGLFKAPSLRNVDLRPDPTFVKSYMHNGVFKSLEEVVHFYNKRNIATNADGDEEVFPLFNPPTNNYTPIFPPAEITDNVQNLYGLTPDQSADAGLQTFVAFDGQIGNLQLTPQEETDLVNFLKTLTDGFASPSPVPSNLAATLATGISPPDSTTFVMQVAGPVGHTYCVQTSTNLTDWQPVSTNVLIEPIINVTNTTVASASQQFWRAVATQ